MQSRIFTIGSSTRTREEFLAILAAYGIRALADVRAFPMSRRFPHFVRNHMAATLPLVGVSYHWLGKRLGGYRTGGYEAYMHTGAYEAGITELEAIARECPTAFLCAERIPTKCHRRFIAATLERRGWNIVHVLEANQIWTTPTPELSFPICPVTLHETQMSD